MQSPLAHLHEGLCEICATEMIFHCQVGVEFRVGKASALCPVDMEGLWWAARGKQSTHWHLNVLMAWGASGLSLLGWDRRSVSTHENGDFHTELWSLQ